MTNHALDAFNRLNLRLPFQDHLRKQYYEDIETIRTALANAPQWLPIETAPKDGTRILLWDEPFSYVPTIDRLGFIRCGYWQYELGFGCADRRRVTHWMPLPAAPEGEG